MNYRGYCTSAGEVEWWAFDVDATTRLHLGPGGQALSWTWSGACWCRLDVTGSNVAEEARRMLDDVPLHLRGPVGATFLPVVAG
jgi:hypothetical protein